MLEFYQKNHIQFFCIPHAVITVVKLTDIIFLGRKGTSALTTGRTKEGCIKVTILIIGSSGTQ